MIRYALGSCFCGIKKIDENQVLEKINAGKGDEKSEYNLPLKSRQVGGCCIRKLAL
jgi:hypothetical protein